MTGLQTTLGENYKRPVNMLVLGVRVYIVTFFSCNFSISYIAACCAINCTKTVQKIFHTLQKLKVCAANCSVFMYKHIVKPFVRTVAEQNLATFIALIGHTLWTPLPVHFLSMQLAASTVRAKHM